ncbi:hypothetical protein D3C76_865110 [compost metagenome]
MKNVKLKMYNKKGKHETNNLEFQAEELTEDQGTMIITNMFQAFGVPAPMAILKVRDLEPNEILKGLDEAACACVTESPTVEQWHPYAAPLRTWVSEEAIPSQPVSAPVERETPTGQRMLDDIVMSQPAAPEKEEPVHKAAPEPAPQPAPVEKKAEPVEGRPKQLPIIGASERTGFSLADNPKAAALLQAAAQIAEATPKAQEVIDERPSHVKTGVKVIEEGGKPIQTFRTRCNCPNCGWRGNRYIRPGNMWAKCFQCETRLAVIPATNRDMIPDEWNNFYHAYEEFIDLREGQHGGESGR